MSYQVLARKYRPRTFADVIGQDHIVKALSRALEKDRIGQAYLLIGPRGTGKTSTARILAKSLNCEKGESVAPCLACGPCLEIESGADMDVVEIDGASNNGVDDVRDLREKVHFRPMRDRRKVYIIDEIQRLTGPAFDALLKTLEEPPDHVIFLFATTDPQKIPDTIVSRCQTFEFRRLREDDILSKLLDICQKEGVEVPEDVLCAISRGCRGGLRDAESMLDQLLAVTEGVPTLEELEMVAGLARPECWQILLEAVSNQDGAQILKSVDAFLQRGGTERDFVEQLVDALRDLLHVALLGEDVLGVVPSADRQQRMVKLAGALGQDRLETLMGMFFSLESRMNQSPLSARALLEWTLLRASRLGDLLETTTLLQNLRSGTLTATSVSAEPPAPVKKPEPVRASAPTLPSPPTSPTLPTPSPSATSIQDLLKEVRERRPSLGRVLTDYLVEGTLHEDRVEVVLQPLEDRSRRMVEDPIESRFLKELPSSPGPWTIRYFEKVQRHDPLGEQLKSSFEGVEEVP